jgi:hypothetical protein
MHKPVGEWIVTEIEKLTNLREKLVIRRRSLVEGFQKSAPERLSGDSAGEELVASAVLSRTDTPNSVLSPRC